MLQAIDTLIGFVLVMLLLSNAVTFLVQSISTVLNMRGSALVKGLAALLVQVAPNLPKEGAAALADAVLRHPSVGSFSTFLGIPVRGGKRTLASVITREELVQILLSLGDRVANPTANPKDKLTTEAQSALDEVLKAAKVTQPGTLLENIRKAALEVERSSPQLASHVRTSQAIFTSVREQGKKLVADVYATFDNGMSRVSELFTMNARIATLVASVVVTLLIPVDSIQLFRSLWIDPQLRAAAVEAAKTIDADPAPLGRELADARNDISGILAQKLKDTNIELLPKPSCDALAPEHRLGLAVTVLLLCLGAQFWFDLLKNLLKLRPVLAGKEDQQRKERDQGDSSNALP